MILCHCSILTCRDVREAVDVIRGPDGLGVVTPGAVFRQCGKRPCCGCCMPQIVAEIHDHFSIADGNDAMPVVCDGVEKSRG